MVVPGDQATGNQRSVGSEVTMEGVPVSLGLGYGRPCFYREKIPETTDVNRQNRKAGGDQLLDTFNELSEQLRCFSLRAKEHIDDNTAEIFTAHQMIINSEVLQQKIINTYIKSQFSEREAIEQCFNEYYAFFHQVDDEYLSSISNDFSELKQLLLNLLSNTESYLTCREQDSCEIGECALKNNHILIVKELEANVAIRINEYTKGIIAEKCGKNSHAAVIARSLNIPVISGIKNLHEQISHDDELLIDGNTGKVTINPNDVTLSFYHDQINNPTEKYVTSDSIPQLKILADIDRYTDVQFAIKTNADGIGMYRTEFELLNKGRLLSENEQYDCYLYVMENMKDKPVYIRLFDLGSDKSAPWLGIKDENNPALGWRGARLLLSRPDIFRSQARALARVSQLSTLHVLYPMITSLTQFLQLKNKFLEAITDIVNTNLLHGIMFEVPSACIQANLLYKEIDFGRVGCNDLIQYLFAFDRTRDDFYYEELADDPTLWIIISNLVEIAKAVKKPLEVCGELASNPTFIPRLIEMGISTISIKPENIATTRKFVSNN